MDNEMSNSEGTSYTAQFWQYDTRLGRRWNKDPMTYYWHSPYLAFNNNPLRYIDPYGLYGTEGKAEKARKRAVDKHGEDRVGDKIYQDKENGSWYYAIYDDPRDKIGYPVEVNPGDDGGVQIVGETPDRIYGIVTATWYNIMENAGFHEKYDYPNWVTSAKQDIGLHEVNDKDEVAVFTTYEGLNSDEGTFTFDDGIGTDHAWCGAFANYHLEENGWNGPEVNAAAVPNWNGSWREWEDGVEVVHPVFSAIVTLGDDHVGFVVGMLGDQILILGGNQGNEVNVMARDVQSSYKFWLPKGYKPHPADSNKKHLQTTYTGEVKGVNSTR